VEYTSYGSGAKPLILGSKQENQLSDWTDLGGNIWSNNDASFTVDVGNIIFDNEASVGVKKWNEADLAVQGDFWYDEVNDLVKIYSVGNPASVYSNIECTLMKHIVSGTSKSYIAIDGLDFRYGAAHGIQFITSNHINISNNNFAFIGGGDQLGGVNTTRYGNAIEFWNTADNVFVEKNSYTDIWDEAMTCQMFGGAGIFSNIYFRNNIYTDTRVGITMYSQTGGSLSNIFIEHNTGLYGDGGWQIDQMTGSGSNIINLSTDSNTLISNYFVRNNIFYGNATQILMVITGTPTTNMFLDNNCYYRPDGGRIANWKSNTYNQNQFNTYQSATGQDLHSISADPLLTADYHLKAGSPCIDKGIDVGVRDTYFGDVRPRGSGTDIGADELQYTRYSNSRKVKVFSIP
jgi:hypothetical protein